MKEKNKIMRIIHISDYHLDKKSANDSATIASMLSETLKSINNEKKIDLILYSGDMINTGGSSYDSIGTAFKGFELIFIDKILKTLNLPKNNFLFTIGNHDIDRNADSKYVEMGLSQTLKLEHSSDKKEGIIKKKHTNKFIAFGQLMLLAMNVLKNSEEIHEENLKADSYTRILKNSISYVVLYKMICEEIINHFEEFPKERVEEFKFVLRFLPVIHQNLISDNLGTYKLAEVIKEKIEADKVSGNKAVISEFEKFLSVYLYCDIKGDGYKAIMGDFIKNINKTYIADSCFFKLLAYYYSSTTPSDDNSIVNLLADLYIKVNANKNSNKRINKSALIQKFKKEKAELE